MKLLVVGCASKGRTTFVKRLKKEKALRGLSQSELFFEMDDWTYSPSSNVSPVTFKIWDFSGKVRIKHLNTTGPYHIHFYYYRNFILAIIIGFIQSVQSTLWCSVYETAILVCKN